MPSIDNKHLLAAALFILASFGVFAAPPSPRILTEPVLGLRYEAARVKFDPLPSQLVANCEGLTDAEEWHSIWFIYARAQDASGRTYYATGGYDIAKHSPGKPQFTTGDAGLIFYTDRGACTTLEQVRNTFDARLFDEDIAEPVLKLLAADYAKRLERAFGGAAKLRAELRNQYIDKDTLPPELLDALKPYLTK
ncbi:hypothetical protein [Massilia sp.]|uniref:hypothetical protein n=1 Tax=Massilia sp. TaxID=1882437 RepID=UPI0028AC5EFE|nr:hypothetical protein [Massilia sp.]